MKELPSNLFTLRILALTYIVLVATILVLLRRFYWRSGSWRYNYVYRVFEQMLRRNGELQHEKSTGLRYFLKEFFVSGFITASALRNFYLEKLPEWELEFDESTASRIRLGFKDAPQINSFLDFEREVSQISGQDLLSSTQRVKLLEMLRRPLLITEHGGIPESEGLILAGKNNNSFSEAWTGIWMDLSDLINENGFDVPVQFFISNRHSVTVSDCIILADHIRQAEKNNRYIVIFTLTTPSSEIQYYLKERIGRVFAYDVILFDLDGLFDLLVAVDHLKALRHFILSQVDLTKISPYSLNGPTPEKMFFGREQEIRLILENIYSKSYAIMGGRRIGKSSILIRLHRVIFPASGIHSAYVDMSTINDYEEFLKRKIPALYPEYAGEFPSTFEGLLNYQSGGGKVLICILFDEVDKVVAVDRQNDWKIFKALRSFANSGAVHIVFSGEQTLREAIRDPSSPLFNFTNEIILHPLEFHSVEELVLRSMNQLDIKMVETEEILNNIFLFTSGHPNIVQRLCHRLIENVNQEGVRLITLNLVKSVVNSPSFLRDDFLGTVWESSTALEKIISLVMVNEEKPLSVSKIQQLLDRKANLKPRAKDVDDAIQRLVDLRSILGRTVDGYEIVNRAFRTAVSRVITIDDILGVLVDEYKEQL